MGGSPAGQLGGVTVGAEGLGGPGGSEPGEARGERYWTASPADGLGLGGADEEIGAGNGGEGLAYQQTRYQHTDEWVASAVPLPPPLAASPGGLRRRGSVDSEGDHEKVE